MDSAENFRGTSNFNNTKSRYEQNFKASSDSLFRESDRKNLMASGSVYLNTGEREKAQLTNAGSLNMTNLSRIPEDIKKRLNIPLFGGNIASVALSPTKKDSEEIRTFRKNKNSSSKLFEKNQSATTLNNEGANLHHKRTNSSFMGVNALEQENNVNASSKTLHKRNNSGNSFSGVYSKSNLMDNSRYDSNKKIVVPVQNPFMLHGNIKCHKYHTDLDHRLLVEDRLNKDKNYVVLDTGHDKNYDKMNKHLAKAKLPVSIPIYKQSSEKLYEGYANLDEENQKTLNDNNSFYYGSNEYSSKVRESKNAFNKQFSKGRKNSDLVLSDVLDVNFSLNSPPTGKKLNQNEIYSESILANNEETEKKMNFNILSQEDLENLLKKYQEGLENIMVCIEPVFDRLSTEERVLKFLENTSDPRRGVRLGALVALYLSLKKYEFDDNCKQVIIEKLVNLLQNYEVQEENFLVVCLEILQLFAPNDIIYENISLICMFLTDFNYHNLQRAAFNCIMSMELEGIKTLVQLASKDYTEFQSYILQSLLSTPHIQKILIIKALMNEVLGNNMDRRQAALAALNRMGDLVGETEAIISLSKLFSNQRVEKILLCSTMRTSGVIGEKVLVNEMRNNKDPNIRSAIASVLQYRIPVKIDYLPIRLDNNDNYTVTRSLPGSFCTYFGKISPLVFETESDLESQAKDFLLVNSRDFLAALQRMVQVNMNHEKPKIVHHGNVNTCDYLDFNKIESEHLAKYISHFQRDDFQSSDSVLESTNINMYNKTKLYVNEDVMRGLAYCLKDYHQMVKLSVITTIGNIGVPEGLLTLESLLVAAKDNDVDVRAKSIWAIGKLAHACDPTSVIPNMIDALKSNMWKVKSASMHTISIFGDKCARHALPVLAKQLKESAINKNIIADTIVKLGNEGEEYLLRLIKSEPDSQYKIKTVAIRAFALMNINSPNVDFIVEALYKAGQSLNANIRKSSLYSLRVLQSKANEEITYLRVRHILPFYYKFLRDKEPDIQAYAIDCIKDLGPQGELLFIEGLSKDSNPIVRSQCAAGLAAIGPQTLRTLVIGLFDDNQIVRKAVEKEILEKMTLESIAETFNDKNSQKLSLKIALRDVLEKDIPISPDLSMLFKDILLYFERNIEIIPSNYSSRENFNQDQQSNHQENYNNMEQEEDGDGREVIYDNMEVDQRYA